MTRPTTEELARRALESVARAHGVSVADVHAAVRGAAEHTKALGALAPEELVAYLLKEFEEQPDKIWESNIFGTSLYGLVNEGLHNKLYHMPAEARMKLKETVERVINEGCNGLICIIV